jgi:hypothetical protein
MAKEQGKAFCSLPGEFVDQLKMISKLQQGIFHGVKQRFCLFGRAVLAFQADNQFLLAGNAQLGLCNVAQSHGEVILTSIVLHRSGYTVVGFIPPEA